MSLNIRQLTAEDTALMQALSSVFGEAFEDLDTYAAKRPGVEYLRTLLEGDSFIALAALIDGAVVGGIAAYELRKFEQERSELYIYDLAVAAPYRRRGIATALIEALRKIALDRGAYGIFVQADTSAEDEPAIALYSKLGRKESVLHFDIAVTEET